jgi:hypothetical protein
VESIQEEVRIVVTVIDDNYSSMQDRPNIMPAISKPRLFTNSTLNCPLCGPDMVRAAQAGDGTISNEQVGSTLGLYDRPVVLGGGGSVVIAPSEGKDTGIEEPMMKPAVMADISQDPKNCPPAPTGSGTANPGVTDGKTDMVRVAAGGLVVVGVLAGACLGVKSILRL